VNDFGNIHGLNWTQSEKDLACHIWDWRDSAERMCEYVTTVAPRSFNGRGILCVIAGTTLLAN